MKNPTEDGPDKGWSWVVAFACFLIALVVVGIYRTSGILLVAFVNEYGVSREDSSWPLFLCFSLTDIAGIITGPLGQRFEVRAITLIGSLVSAAGVSLCYFANSLTFITVSFGIISGIGFGLTYNLLPIMINQYFLKHRATANGLANSGVCFGSMIFPPVYEYLMLTYGLNGSLLLIGGIILQLAISGTLMKPPSWLNFKASTDTLTIDNKKSLPNKLYTDIKYSYLKTDDILDNSTNITYEDAEKDEVIIKRRTSLSLTSDGCQSLFEKNMPQQKVEYRFNQTSTKTSDNYNEDNSRYTSKLESPAEDGVKHKKVKNKFYEEVFSSVENDQKEIKPCSSSNDIIEEVVDENPKLEEKRTLITDPNDGQVVSKNQTDIFVKRLAPDTDTLYETCHTINPETNIKCLNEPENEVAENQDTHMLKTKEKFSVLMSFKHVLTCPMFYVIAISNVLFFSKEEMFFVINVDFYIDKGIDEHDTKYLIIIFSISDLFGRVCFGWVTDRKYLRRSHFMMICMALVSIVFFSFPFANGYASLLVLNSLYGLLLGCTTIVFFVIPLDYLDMETHAVAFGCMAFINGLLTLTFSLLIGHFRDQIGSYSSIFYIMGTVSLVSSSLWLLENCFIKQKTELKIVEVA